MSEPNQTNTIVHPRYGCAIGAAYTVTAIPGAVPIAHCGPGCVDKQYFILSGGNGFQGCVHAGGGATPSTNIGENEVVFGGADKLDRLVESTFKIMKGDLYVVLSGCSSKLVGNDVSSVVRKRRQNGEPLVISEAPGFKGTNLTGHELVIRSVIDQFVGTGGGRKRRGLINLWSEVPYFNTNWRGDLMELKRVLTGAGFSVNVLFGPESGGVAEWKTIPKAQFNLLVSPWVGLSVVEYLEEKYRQPWLHIPVVPVGEEATSNFLREVVDFADMDPRKSEAFIARESDIYYYFLEHFSDFFAEYWFGLPSSYAAVGDSLTNIALSKFVADQIGLIPTIHIVTDNPPEARRPAIAKLYEELSEGVGGEVVFLEDGYRIEERLRNTDFGASSPLIFGSSWETDIAREVKGLLLEVGTPVTEVVVLNKSYIGYRGALSLIEQIYSATLGGY